MCCCFCTWWTLVMMLTSLAMVVTSLVMVVISLVMDSLRLFKILAHVGSFIHVVFLYFPFDTRWCHNWHNWRLTGQWTPKHKRHLSALDLLMKLKSVSGIPCFTIPKSLVDTWHCCSFCTWCRIQGALNVGRPVAGQEGLVPKKSILTGLLLGLSICTLVIPDEEEIVQ